MLNYLRNRINIPLLLLLLYNIVSLFMSAKGDRETLPTFDSVFFISIAYNILHFGDLGWVAYHEPLLYSAAIAMFSFLTDNLLNSAILVSKTSKVLLVIVTFLLGKKIYGNTVGLVSAALVTFMPQIINISVRPESESLFAFLITLSIYLLWLTYKNPTLIRGFFTGVAFSATYLARSEGVLIFIFLMLSLAFIEVKRRTINRKFIISMATVVVVFLISSIPYFIFLKNHYGVWTLGTKTSSIYFWLRNRTFNDPDPVRTEWGLSPKGEINVISMTSRDVINYWLKDPAKGIKIYLHNLKTELPGFIPNDSGTWHYPQVYPVYLAIPLMFGLMIKRRKRVPLDEDIYLMSVFLILVIYPFLTEGWWRYLVNYLPIFMVLAASGLNEINEDIKGYLIEKGVWKRTYGNSLLWIVVLGISSYHLWVMAEGKPPEDKVRYNERKYLFALETKKAGEWAQKRFPPGSNYMAEWTRLPYYLNGRWTAKPEATLDGMIWYAKKNRVDYIVYETSGKGESEEIIRVMGNTPDLEVADVYESQGQNYGVVFLRLKSDK